MRGDLTKKVLIVDKDPISRKYLKLILRRIGFKDIVIADNQEQAITHIHHHVFPLVFIDFQISGMTGLDLVRFIRRDDTLKKMQVFLTVLEGERVNLLDAVKAGINGYVTKPYSKPSVQQKIDAVFSSMKAFPTPDSSMESGTLLVNEKGTASIPPTYANDHVRSS